MIDLLADKLNSGDGFMSLARHHLGNHEWGAARLALEQAFEKGQLSDLALARHLMHEVCQRLGIELERASGSL